MGLCLWVCAYVCVCMLTCVLLCMYTCVYIHVFMHMCLSALVHAGVHHSLQSSENQAWRSSLPAPAHCPQIFMGIPSHVCLHMYTLRTLEKKKRKEGVYIKVILNLFNLMS